MILCFFCLFDFLITGRHGISTYTPGHCQLYPLLAFLLYTIPALLYMNRDQYIHTTVLTCASIEYDLLLHGVYSRVFLTYLRSNYQQARPLYAVQPSTS